MLARRTLRHGEEAIHLTNGGMYRVVAANRRSARGLRAVDLVFLDEVRELRTFEAVGAITPDAGGVAEPAAGGGVQRRRLIVGGAAGVAGPRARRRRRCR